MTALQAALRNHDRVALDTNVLIYEFDSNPTYLALTNVVFRWLEEPIHRAVTSTITMTEMLVKPYRSDERLADDIYAVLSSYPHLEWIPASLEIADEAARLRASHGLRTIDALQAATAIRSGATALIGNDAAFKRVPGIEILLLDDFVA